MKITKPINSERLLFREIDLTDTEAIVAWRSNPEVYQFFKNPIKLDHEQHIKWFNASYQKNDARIDFMALDSDGNRVGVFGIIINGDSAEINYLVSPKQQRKGYATEGVLRIIQYASNTHHVKTFQAEIHKDNIASINLAKKIGFKLSRTHDSFEIYKYMIPEMVYFRVDGNSVIGLGHVMRCISIAEAAKKYGCDSTFIISDESSRDIITSYGFKTLILGTNWKKLDEEIPIIQKIIRKRQIKNLLIDSYLITSNYIDSLPCHTMYIDDFVNDVFPVNALICYAAYWEQLKIKSKYKKAELLLGPSYTPLRKEFTNVGKKVINKNIQKVLLLSGGTNPDSIIERISKILVNNTDFLITIVCGSFSNTYSKLYDLYKDNWKVNIINSTTDMLSLMKDADLTITAGGTTMYELCVCGTPAISYSVAVNQLRNVRYFNENGYISYIGDSKNQELEQNLIRAISSYSNREIRLEKSHRMQTLIDGFGAHRIVKIMIKLSQ